MIDYRQREAAVNMTCQLIGIISFAMSNIPRTSSLGASVYLQDKLFIYLQDKCKCWTRFDVSNYLSSLPFGFK